VAGSPLILNLGANPATKGKIEEITADALAQLGVVHEEHPEGSIDRTLIEVAAATLRRVLGADNLDAMEQRIQARLREQA
jgi:hypothetical protein